MQENLPEVILGRSGIGMEHEDLAEEVRCVVGPGLLQIDKTEVELGIGIGGNESKFGIEFIGRFGPVLPKNIGLAGKVMSPGERSVGLPGAMQRGNGMRVGAEIDPQLATEARRL